MAKYSDNNPIKWVGSSSGTIPAPSGYQWDEEDVSSSDAGRTEDTVMHKNTIGVVAALTLKWAYLTTAEIHTVLTAFQEEYFDVCFLDPQAGGYRTATFYVGNRTTPLYNSTMDLWTSLSFKIIERSGVRS